MSDIHVTLSEREARSLVHSTELLEGIFKQAGLQREDGEDWALETAGQKVAHALEIGEKEAV